MRAGTVQDCRQAFADRGCGGAAAGHAQAEVESDPEASSRRKRAAQERAARQGTERAARARAALDKGRAEKEQRAKTHRQDEAKKSEPKVSLSDPEARHCVLPMARSSGLQRADCGRAEAGHHRLGGDDGSAQRRGFGRADGERHGQSLWQGTGEPSARHPLRHQRGYRRPGRACGGPVKVFAPRPSERDDVKTATLAKRAKQRAQEPIA